MKSKRVRISSYILAFTVVPWVAVVYGQETLERELVEIREFAVEICISPNIEATSSGFELNGDAKAKVNGGAWKTGGCGSGGDRTISV